MSHFVRHDGEIYGEERSSIVAAKPPQSNFSLSLSGQRVIPNEAKRNEESHKKIKENIPSSQVLFLYVCL